MGAMFEIGAGKVCGGVGATSDGDDLHGGVALLRCVDVETNVPVLPYERLALRLEDDLLLLLLVLALLILVGRDLDRNFPHFDDDLARFCQRNRHLLPECSYT